MHGTTLKIIKDKELVVYNPHRRQQPLLEHAIRPFK